MRRVISLVILTMAFVTSPAVPQAQAISVRHCDFQGLDRERWSYREVYRTVTCFANKFGVSATQAHYYANRESRYNEKIYNGICCGGLFQHHLKYWAARADWFPDWQRWMHIYTDDWRNPRIQSLVTILWVKKAGWCVAWC